MYIMWWCGVWEISDLTRLLVCPEWWWGRYQRLCTKTYCLRQIQQASGLCYVLRRIVSEDEFRQAALCEIFEKHLRIIVFYNFVYELDILKGIHYGNKVKVAECNGHAHQPIPDSKSLVYLVQYTAGAEGWNSIKTDTIIFFSQNYSYKIMQQASGRIDRLNTPFRNLYYYHFKTRASIDIAIGKTFREKKQFNECIFVKW